MWGIFFFFSHWAFLWDIFILFIITISSSVTKSAFTEFLWQCHCSHRQPPLLWLHIHSVWISLEPLPIFVSFCTSSFLDLCYKWNKPVIREHVFNDSIYSKGPGKIDVQKQSKLVVIWDWGSRGGHMVGMGTNCKWTKRIFLRQWNILELDCGNICKTGEFTKNHWVIHFQWICFMACKLYCKRPFKNTEESQ